MSKSEYEISFGNSVKPVQGASKLGPGFLPVDMRKAKKAAKDAPQLVITQCPEIETNEEYLNRFKKSNHAVLAGAPLPLKPRPPPHPPNDITMDSAENDEPSLFSELVRGGQSFQDPYATFFDDIKGWDEDKCEDLVLKLITDSSKVSYKYLTCESNQETNAPTTRKKCVRKKKSAAAPAINVALQTNPQMENEEDLDNNGDKAAEFEQSTPNQSTTVPVEIADTFSGGTRATLIEKKLHMTLSPKPITTAEQEHILPIFNPSKELLLISLKNEPEIAQNIPAEYSHMSKIASLRKKLCTSASPSKSYKLNMKDRSLGIPCLKGKKYYSQETETIKTLRAKTAGPKLSTSRTVLPVITPPTPSSLQESLQSQSWGIIKGVSQVNISTSSNPNNQRYPNNSQTTISHNPGAVEEVSWLADKGALITPIAPAVRRGPKKLSPYGFKTVKVPNQQCAVSKLADLTQEHIPTISTINSNYDWADLDFSNLRVDHKFPNRSFRTQMHITRGSD
ncbi:hypothetical protein HDV01_001077 [Terramyces sp. JEL0728]|nr:hypothetical protein HDV01_001077 [Terramyces sp. JEL0728]